MKVPKLVVTMAIDAEASIRRAVVVVTGHGEVVLDAAESASIERLIPRAADHDDLAVGLEGHAGGLVIRGDRHRDAFVHAVDRLDGAEGQVGVSAEPGGDLATAAEAGIRRAILVVTGQGELVCDAAVIDPIKRLIPVLPTTTNLPSGWTATPVAWSSVGIDTGMRSSTPLIVSTGPRVRSV